MGSGASAVAASTSIESFTSAGLRSAAKASLEDVAVPLGPKAPRNLPITRPRETLRVDLATKVELSIRCEQLQSIFPTVAVLYSKWEKDSHWTEIGFTEVHDKPTTSPVFSKSFWLEFRMDQRRDVRVELFHVQSQNKRDLRGHRFVGSAETTLAEIATSRSFKTGWLVQLLENSMVGGEKQGKIAWWLEEDVRSKEMVSFVLAASGLKSQDFWKRRADPYCIVHRTLNVMQPKQGCFATDDDVDSFHGDADEDALDLHMVPVYRSEVCRHSSQPRWDRIELTVPMLCNSNMQQEIVIEVHDWFRTQEDRYVGEVATNYEKLHKAFRDTQPISLPLEERRGKRKPGRLLNKFLQRSREQNPSPSHSNSRTPTRTMSRHSTKPNSRLPSNLVPDPGSRRSTMQFHQKLEPLDSFQQERSDTDGPTPGKLKALPSAQPSTLLEDDLLPKRMDYLNSPGSGRRGASKSGSDEDEQGLHSWETGRSSSRLAPHRTRSRSGSSSISKASHMRPRRRERRLSMLSVASAATAIAHFTNGLKRIRGNPEDSEPIIRLNFPSGRLNRTSSKCTTNTTHSSAVSSPNMSPNPSPNQAKARKGFTFNRSRSFPRSNDEHPTWEKVGEVTLQNIGIMRRYTLLDYIRGGLDLRLAVAIDFTRSSEGIATGRAPNTGLLHDFGGRLAESKEDPCIATLRAVGNVLRGFQFEDKYPVYGFGARLPPSRTACSDCFALTGDFFSPEVQGIDEVVLAYQRALQVVRLHGPTRLQEVIHLISNFAKPFAQVPEKKDPYMAYFVLLVITDGQIDDQMETIEEIVQINNLPLSVVFVDIGSQESSFLRELSAGATEIRGFIDGAAVQQSQRPHISQHRNIVQYVYFNDFGLDRAVDLASAALVDVPREVVGYFDSHGIKPGNLKKFEDKQGNPMDKFLPRDLELENNLRRRATATLALNSKGGSVVPSRTQSRTASVGPSTALAAIGSQAAGGAIQESKFDATATSAMQSTGMSGVSGVVAAIFGKEKPEIEGRPPRAPFQFLSHEKERLRKDLRGLGYTETQIGRALRDGLPAISIDVVVDNILNSGYGKGSSYSDAAKAAIPDVEVNLPGQVDIMDILLQAEAAQNPQRMSMMMELQARAASRGITITKEMSKMQGGRPPNDSRGRSRHGTRDGGQIGRTTTRDAQNAAVALLHGTGKRPESKGILRSVSFRDPDMGGVGSEGMRKMTREQAANSRSALGSRNSTKVGKEGDVSPKVGSPQGAGGNNVRFFPSAAQQPQQRSAPALAGSGAAAFQRGGLQPCSVCLERPVATIFKPCGHKIVCSTCAGKIGIVCPLCQATVEAMEE